jgi:cyclic beta-1,2-glucan synthetase
MVGGVLDLELEPYQEVDLTLLLAVAETEEQALRMVMDLAPESRRRWLGLQARSRAEGELLALDVSTGEMRGWEELLAHLLHPRATSRARVSLDSRLDLGMPTLWRWGISGDHPIVLVDTRGDEETELISSVVRAQAYWRTRGISVDVVVRDDAQGGYQDPVKSQIQTLLKGTGQEVRFGGSGGVHILPGSEITEEDRAPSGSAGRRAPEPRAGWPEGEPQPTPTVDPPPPPFLLPPVRSASEKEEGSPLLISPPEGLESPSAYGGFDPEDGEYVIHLPPSTRTPSPWVNVVAREDMGFLVSESGGGFTWSQDAGEYRLSPWSNDPVQDTPGEVVYLRDEDTGSVWTPAPRPLGRPVARRMRHGWGWSFLETGGNGLGEEMEWFLHPELPVKVTRVRLRNRGDRSRRITVTFYVEWVLGTHLARTRPRLLAEYREDLGAVVARNRYVPRFSERWAFLSTDGGPDGVGVDREEFLGLGGLRSQVPPGLRRSRPGERSRPDGPACGVLQRDGVPGAGRDPGGGLLPGGCRKPGGDGGTGDSASRGRGHGAADAADVRPAGGKRLARNPEEWTRWLRTLQVETPDPALNRMVNGWLPYQTLSSRIRGRTGFYQSGGAFGFRDQLQDVFTLLPLDPSLAPRQLEEAARHQFEEGDVLHWWHPGTNRGVRTRCSDDLLWLPFVLAGTVQWTGDMELLERRVPYLTADPLPEGVHERYDEFPVSEREGTLWEHGLRAVERACSLRGERGLPLIGTMDWNDGMDRVGWEGRGESVWLAWFLIRILTDWVELARRRGDPDLAHRLEREREEFRAAVERHGWDGEWYRRAFFDDGSPLGSTQAPEARIDSIAQSWAVISGGADPARARQALESAWRHLVRPEDGLSLLLTPPFDGAGNHPGYIAAYPPGVRENGGQYTHAAAWLIRAVAQLGDGARAGELLELILPPHHARNAEETRRYRVEPYVVAADIYGAPPHVGRGGWTWYTGSAGWIYRVVVEDILGLQRRGAVVRVDPCIPPDWPEFRVSWAVGGGRLEVHVTNPDGVARGVVACQVDGEETAQDRIPVPREGVTRVKIRLGNGRGTHPSQGAETPFETLPEPISDPPVEPSPEPVLDPGVPTEARRGAGESRGDGEKGGPDGS